MNISFIAGSTNGKRKLPVSHVIEGIQLKRPGRALLKSGINQLKEAERLPHWG